MDVQFGPFTVAITFNESVSDFTARDITLGGESATVTNVTGRDRIYTATITPATTADGDVTIRVPAGVAQDAAGDGNTASDTYTVHVEPDETIWMPDANLRREVRNRLGLADNVLLTQTAMQELDELFAGAKGITDLTGLEYATEVFRLELYDNSIRDLTPLAGLPSVTILHLYNNNILDLTPLSGEGYWVLSLWDNPFLELPAAEITVPTSVQTGAFDVAISFGQPVTGFEQSGLSISGAANAVITSWDANITGDRYTARITPAADGDVVLNVAAGAADGTRRAVLRQSFQNGLFLTLNIKPPVGDASPTDATLADLQEQNIAAVQKTVNVNMALPTTRIDVPSGVQTERFEVTVVFSKAVTDFEQTELSVTGTAGATITDWQPQTGGTDYTATIISTNDGVVVLNVAVDVAQDAAGNRNTAATEKRVQVEIPDETIWMPDANLRREVRNRLGLADNVLLTQTAMQELDELFAGAKGITDLTGLEYATEVFRLELYDNSIRDLTPLAGLPSVTILHLYNNNILDLTPLSGEGYWVLSLWDNPFLELPAAEITVPTSVQTGAFDVAISFGQPVTGFEQSGLSISGAANAVITSWDANITGDRYTARITPAADGDVVLNVAAGAADGTRRAVLRQSFQNGLFLTLNIKPPVGDASPTDATLADLQEQNIAAVQKTVNVNMALPTTRIDVPSGVQTERFEVTVVFSKAVTDFEQTELSVTGTAGATITDWQPQTGGTDYTATIISTNDGVVVLNVAVDVAQDAAGNRNTAATEKRVQVEIPDETIWMPDANLRREVRNRLGLADNVLLTQTAMQELDELFAGAKGITDLTGLEYATEVFRLELYDNSIRDLTPLAGLPSVTILHLYNNNILDLTPLSGEGYWVLSLWDNPFLELPAAEITVPTSVQTGAFDVAISFGQPVTGFEQSGLSISGAANATITSWDANITGDRYTARITPAADGDVVLNVTAGAADGTRRAVLRQSFQNGLFLTLNIEPPVGDASPTDATLADLQEQNIAAVQKTVNVNLPDETGPSVEITGVPTTTQTGAFTVTITFSESVTGFVAGDITLTGVTATATLTGSGTTYTATITPTSTGTLTIQVPADVAQDTLGNDNTASQTHTVQVDPIQPTVSINVPSSVQNGAFTVTITFSESVTGFAAGDITLTGVTATATLTGSGTTYTATITPTSTGTLTIQVPANVAQDTADNYNTASQTHTVQVDVTKPTVSISVPSGEQTGEFMVTVEFSEAVNGFVQDELTFTTTGTADATITNWTGQDGNTTYTATVLPSGTGNLVFNVAANVATDTAGNSNTAATQQTVAVNLPADTTRPTVSISVPSGEQTGEFMVTVEFSEAVNGFVQDELTFTTTGTADATITNWTGQDGNTTYTATVLPSGTGNLVFNVAANVATDTAGNSNTAATQQTVAVNLPADTTRPTVSINVPSSVQNGAFTVTITFSESVTGFAAGDITLTGATATATLTGSGTTYTATITPTSTGTLTIQVPANGAQDAAGNYNTAATAKTVQVDITKPTVTIEVPSGEQTGEFDVTITFSESVTGFVAGDITLTGVTATATLTGSGTTYTATITPTSTGTLTIQVPANVAQDTADNYNTASQTHTVQVDVTKPTVSISVPSGVQTGEFDVTITFSEAVNGFVQNELTFTTTGTSSATITNWTGQDGDTTYTATILPSGTGNLVFNVAANVATDTAGNSNTAATQQTVAVNLPADTTRPTVSISVPSGEQTGEFDVTITFSESVTGFAAGDITLTGVTATATLTGSGTTYTATITPTTQGNLTIQVPDGVAQDEAGNRNIASEAYTVPVNPTAPVDPIAEDGPEPLIIVERDGTKYATGTPPFAGTDTAPVIFYVIIKFDEAVTGFVLDDLILGAPEDLGIAEAKRRVSITEWSGEDDNPNYTAKNYTAKVKVAKNANVGIWVPANVAQAADNSAWNVQSAKQSVSVWIDGAAEDEDIVPPSARIEVLQGPGVTIVVSSGGPISLKRYRVTGIFKIEVVFSEPVSGFIQTDLKVSVAGNTSANITDWAANPDSVRYTATITPTEQGNLRIRVPSGVAQDAAGNRNVPAATFIKIDFPDQADTTRPTVSINVPSGEQTGEFDVTITFSEAVIGFTQSDLSLGGTVDATITAWTTTGNITYAATLTPHPANGEVTLNVPANVARDLANNGNTPAEAKTVTISNYNSRPTVSIRPPTGAQHAPFEVIVEFSAVVTGFVQDELLRTGTARTRISNWVADAGGARYTATLTPTHSGTLILTVASGAAMAGTAGNRSAAPVTVLILPEDVDRDGDVDIFDLFEVGLRFGQTIVGDPEEGNPDVNRDGEVDIMDFNMVEGRIGTNIGGAGTATPSSTRLTALRQDIRALGSSSTVPQDAIQTLEKHVRALAPADTSPPGASISVPSGVQNGAFDATITFTEVVSGFAQSDVSLSGTASATITSWTASSNTTYTATLTPTTSGSVTLNINAGVATDAANNQNTAATSQTVTVSVDTESPGVSISVPSGTQTGAFNATITFTESVSGFTQSDLSVGGTASATITSWTASSNTTYTAAITPTTSGEATVSVPANVAIDAASNNNTASNTQTVSVDMDPPGVSLSVPSGVQTGVFSVTITFSEAVSGFAQSDVSLSGTASATITSWTASSNTTYTVRITPTTSGEVTLSVPANVATDAANNNNTASNTKTVIVDVDPPGVSVSVPSGVQTGAFSVTITFTETVSGFAQSDVSLSGTASATITSWTASSNTTYTVRITPTTSGEVTLSVPANVATDAANNNNTASNTKTVKVDVDRPSVSVTVPSGVQTGAFSVTITFSEAVSGFTQSDVSLSGTASATITSWTASSNTTYTATLTPTTSGSVTLNVNAGVATDAANNQNTAATSQTVTVSVDTESPGVSISVPSGTQTGAFNATITFTESVSGFTQSDLSVGGTASASITAWSANSDNTTFTAAITPTTSGEVMLSVPANVATDAANNNNTASNTKAVTINIPPPTPDPATWMPDANLRAAVGTSLNLQPSETLTQAKMLHLTELKAAGRSISNITGIEYATNLTTARFAKNRILNISPLAGLTQLTRLRLQDNQVSSISSLSRLANLTELFLGNNQIADVTPLAGLVNLTTLRLAGNPFENSGANAEMLNTLRAAGVNIDIPAAVGAPAGERGAYPDETLLLPNYPNPFNPETWIPYQLAEDANVTLTIYDIRGAMVRQLDLGYQVPGYYINQESAAYWDGMDENGEPVAVGLYFYQLSTPSFRQLRRMVILK